MTNRLRVLQLVACALALLAPVAAHAVQPDEMLPDAAQEKRARHISAGLRCLVCQNQSIDDSNAPLARDLRLLVRERLTAGDTDTQVRAYVVARYGDFVLLRPPFNLNTLLLWLTPLLVLVGIAGLILPRLRAAPASPESAPLTADEEKRLKRLLDETPKA